MVSVFFLNLAHSCLTLLPFPLLRALNIYAQDSSQEDATARKSIAIYRGTVQTSSAQRRVTALRVHRVVCYSQEDQSLIPE